MNCVKAEKFHNHCVNNETNSIGQILSSRDSINTPIKNIGGVISDPLGQRKLVLFISIIHFAQFPVVYQHETFLFIVS